MSDAEVRTDAALEVAGPGTDDYFEADRYEEFCATQLAHLDELVLDWVASDEFDRLLVDTVRGLYPAHEHEPFIVHFRGLVGQWIGEQTVR